MTLHTRVRNDLFDRKKNHDRGVNSIVFLLWYFVKCLFFLSPLPWPSGLRTVCLRWFGGKIGKGVYIKPRVNIHYPWKIAIGDFSWLGEEVCIINFEPVTIGAHCCLSQRSILCAGNHDFRDRAMSYRNEPIEVSDGAWVGCAAFVGPGVTIGIDAVITAGSIVTSSVPPGVIVRGNPASVVGLRFKDENE